MVAKHMAKSGKFDAIVTVGAVARPYLLPQTRLSLPLQALQVMHGCGIVQAFACMPADIAQLCTPLAFFVYLCITQNLQ